MRARQFSRQQIPGAADTITGDGNGHCCFCCCCFVMIIMLMLMTIIHQSVDNDTDDLTPWAASLCVWMWTSRLLSCRVSICFSSCRSNALFFVCVVSVLLVLLMLWLLALLLQWFIWFSYFIYVSFLVHLSSSTLQDDCNEAVDKDIAQHLVRSSVIFDWRSVTIEQVHLHQRKEDAVTPPISKEQLQRYYNAILWSDCISLLTHLAGISIMPKRKSTRNWRKKRADRLSIRKRIFAIFGADVCAACYFLQRA